MTMAVGARLTLVGADGDRKPLAHPVSDDARAGYSAFARELRVSAAVITEAVGLLLAREMRKPRQRWSRWVQQVATEAERIFDERHFPDRSTRSE